MKRRRRFLVGGAAFLGSGATLANAARSASFEYNLGHDSPASAPLGVAATEFAAAVRRESNGRLNIKVFADGAWGTDASMIVQLRAGALPMTLQGMGPLSALVPVASVGSIGFAFRDWRDVLAATNGAVGSLIRRELGAKGLFTLERSWVVGFQQIMTWNRQVRTPDDLGSLKLRVPVGPINVDLFKTLGASPISVNVTEIYTTLQTHLVDGTTGALLDLFARKAYEVTRFLGFTNHQVGFYYVVINPDRWQALPADLQEIVRRNGNLSGARESRRSELQSAAATDIMVRYGMQVNRTEPDAFRARLASYYAHWKSEFGPTAWAALEQYSGRLG